jgi:hypothetical protein
MGYAWSRASSELRVEKLRDELVWLSVDVDWTYW